MCDALPGEEAARLEVGRGLSLTARPCLSAAMKKAHGHISGTRLSIAPWPMQSPSAAFTTLSYPVSCAGFFTPSPISFPFKVFCCGCIPTWFGRSLPCCCHSGSPCSSTDARHLQQHLNPIEEVPGSGQVFFWKCPGEIQPASLCQGEKKNAIKPYTLCK